jgi:hypothetical protein
MVVAGSSEMNLETLAQFCRTKMGYTPEGTNCHKRRCEELNSQEVITVPNNVDSLGK